MPKYNIECALRLLVDDYKAHVNEFVILGHEAVFDLNGIAEMSPTGSIVVGVTGRLYAEIRQTYSEVSGYDGVSIPMGARLLVREGLPLHQVRVQGLPCITLESLRARLGRVRSPAVDVLDKWFAAANEKRLQVEAKYRIPYLELDDQLLFQSIDKERDRVLTPEERFVVERIHGLDWSYQYSDDNNAWRRGENMFKKAEEDILQQFATYPEQRGRLLSVLKFGVDGTAKLYAQYPWLNGYLTGRNHRPSRGLLRAALDGVTPEYIERLRVIARSFAENLNELPPFQYPMYFIHTPDTPKIAKLREMAQGGNEAYYGISVPEYPHKQLLELLSTVTLQELQDRQTYQIFEGANIDVTGSTDFDKLYEIRLYNPTRGYQFFKKF